MEQIIHTQLAEKLENMHVQLWLVAAVLYCLLGSEAASGTGQWKETGGLQQPLSGHVSTLLPSGKVLVVGGYNDAYQSRAEIYDPSVGLWKRIANLTEERYFASSTMLPSGKILITGGSNNLSYLASAELYDPKTGIFSLTGSLSFGRREHTAILLPTGKVLVVGGWNGTSWLTSAELYDPATGAWTPTGSLATGRHRHCAALLPSGKVLVAGGKNSSELASAEIYDPATGSWAPTGSFAEPRSSYTLTLLFTGQVLAAGGYTGASWASSELYDPGSGNWVRTGDLSTRRYHHAAALLPDGKVLIAGGSYGTYLASSEIYDPNTGSWSNGGDLHSPRSSAIATILPSGSVLIIGGYYGGQLARAEIYEPEGGSWSPTGSLITPRDWHTATLLPSGTVLVAGGSNASGFLADAEIYDPLSGTWSKTGSLATPRRDHTATALASGRVLVVGGYNGSALSGAEIYDPETSSWRSAGTLVSPRYRHAATLLPSGEVLVSGGQNQGQPLPSAEIYNPETDNWSVAEPMIQARTRHFSILLPSGNVLICGGWAINYLTSCELYDPSTKSWTSVSGLATERESATATLLPSGQILVAGGFDYFYQATAETYDSTAGLWDRTSGMLARRVEHQATLMPSGRVLVTGGFDGVSYTAITEIYEPAASLFSLAPAFAGGRARHSATLLRSGKVLIVGGWNGNQSLATAFLFAESSSVAPEAPRVQAAPYSLRFGETLAISGTGFGGPFEASAGNSGNSAVNFPLVLLHRLDGTEHVWLEPDSQLNFSPELRRLEVSRLPPTINPGPHLLSVVVAGTASAPVPIDVHCGIAVTRQPVDQTVILGQTATFEIEFQGARRLQWLKNGVAIPGATFSKYTTAPVTAADSGASYSVLLDSLCTTVTSENAFLAIADSVPPNLVIVTPNGGEYWPLSGVDTTNTELITWEATDNIRVCQVQASLLYSNNGGQTWIEAPVGGGLPATFGQTGPCGFPGVETSSLTYTVPQTPPSGSVGSLYKIRLRVTDQAGNMTEASSANPFFIVQPNPDSVKTLILTNLARMRSVQGISQADSDVLANNLLDLSNHPRVQGRLVDLSLVPSITSAIATWDADSASPSKTNAVVSALRDYLRIQLLPTYTGVESIVIVGDDRIVPMARLVDATLTPESTYTSATTGSLTTSSTVGKALSQNYYLSDDLLGIRSAITLPISAEAFAAGRFIPTLAVGRLVETPTEILKTIATFISKDGVLDLGPLLTTTNHKVLVTGYDFLIDSATQIRNSWQLALGVPISSTALAPVDGELISSNWGGGNVSVRRDLLRTHLTGNGGATYGINSLNGHATHFEEGVPGPSPIDIQGLSASEIYGPHSCGNTTAINLPGAVVYSVGCHGGLPVPGSCISDADRSLDLPQTMMARGVVAYLANSGYGWGIKYGIGVSERLVQIFSEELMSGGTIHLGKAVVRSKRRYFLEQPGFDIYDQKSLLQWTYFGLPMYSVQTGIPAPSTLAPWSSPPEERPNLEKLGAVTVERRVGGGTTAVPPDYLLSLGLRFNLSAPSIYKKYDSQGNALGTAAGCPDINGCYYTLNGLVERGSGTPDLPIQPYLVYDSRISGTSQHGALWLGGDYHEESGWRPIFAELVTNHGDYSNHGSTPRLIRRRPTSEWIEIGDSSAACRPSDLEINSLVAVAGDALKVNESDPIYSRQRLFQNMDLEALYFNDQGLGGNCDRQGPVLGAGFGTSYHQAVGARIDWAVAASDPAGVWRVVVVYDLGPDSSGNGRWRPVELAVDGAGVWRGSLVPAGVPRVTYMIQAVDRRGNVEWVDFVAASLPTSGLVPDLPMPFDVSLATVQSDLRVQVTDAPDPVVAGNVLAYTVSVVNLGPAPANEITLIDVLPPGVAYGAAAGEGWSCLHQAGTLTCSLPTLALGAAPPLSIFVVVPQAGGTLTNSVTVSALETDPVSSNNMFLVQTFVTSGADLAVTKSDGGAQARPGELLSYTIAASNHGPQHVVGAIVSDLFPADLTGISWTCVATPGSACSSSGNGNIVDTVNLLSGGTLIYQAASTVVPNPSGPIVNTATISAPAGVEDAQQLNNLSRVSTPLFDPALVFADGFESGDFRAWEMVTPVTVESKKPVP